MTPLTLWLYLSIGWIVLSAVYIAIILATEEK